MNAIIYKYYNTYYQPVTDFGWTYNQNFGRLYLETALPGLVETVYLESVRDAYSEVNIHTYSCDWFYFNIIFKSLIYF